MPLERSTSQPRFVIQDMSTGEPERLKQEGAESAMVSPDGRQVALAYRYPSNRYELHIRNNQPNSKPVVILNTSSAFFLAAWSNDSKSILLTTARPDRTWEIAWLSVADGTMKTITSLGWRYMGDRPSLSPDGRYIAYSALANTPSTPVSDAALLSGFRQSPQDSGDHSIYVVSADGSSTREVVKGASINEGAIWTEDGSHLLFLSDRTKTFALYAVAIENGEERGRPFPVRGAAIAERIIPVGMTKNGSYYYVKERRGGTERLFQIQVGADGKVHGPSVHVSDNVVEGEATVAPAWSPDGRRLAFKKQVNRPIPGKSPNWVFDLVIRNENGEETSYAHNMNGGTPVWMHDGTGMLVCTATKNFEIYQLNLKTREFKLVYTRPPTPPASSAALAISPDDKTVYFVEDDSIVALDLATRARRKIWTIPRNVIPWEFSLSPDGRTLAMSAGDGPRRSTYVARVNVDGTGYVQLAPSGQPGLTWTRDGRAILYIDEDKKVMKIPATGGVPESYGLTLNGDFVDFALKPDGSQIVFVSVPPSELWRLDNLSSVFNSEH
jgi:Tol biopolymer transport system component